MANRLLLTLLALLTGLVAQLAPAQARICAAQTAAVAVAAPLPARPQAAPSELARLPEPGWRHVRLVADAVPRPIGPAWRAASVHVGVDRARE